MFSKNFEISNFIKIRPVGAELQHEDEWRGRQVEKQADRRVGGRAVGRSGGRAVGQAGITKRVTIFPVCEHVYKLTRRSSLKLYICDRACFGLIVFLRNHKSRSTVGGLQDCYILKLSKN